MDMSFGRMFKSRCWGFNILSWNGNHLSNHNIYILPHGGNQDFRGD